MSSDGQGGSASSQWQLRHREVGWEGNLRQNPASRDTDRCGTWSEGCPHPGRELVTVLFRTNLYRHWCQPTAAMSISVGRRVRMTVRSIVAPPQALAVGVDMHAHSHLYAVLPAKTNRLIDTKALPPSSVGINRAIAGAPRRTVASENQRSWLLGSPGRAPAGAQAIVQPAAGWRRSRGLGGLGACT